MFKLITFWWLLHSQWLLSLFSILKGVYIPSGFPYLFDTEFVMFVLPTTSIRPFLHISWPWGFSQEISWHPCFFSISPNQANAYTMTFFQLCWCRRTPPCPMPAIYCRPLWNHFRALCNSSSHVWQHLSTPMWDNSRASARVHLRICKLLSKKVQRWQKLPSGQVGPF